MYIQRRIQDFRKEGVCLSILNRRRKPLSVSETLKAPKREGCRDGRPPHTTWGLGGERLELFHRGSGLCPESYLIFTVYDR